MMMINELIMEVGMDVRGFLVSSPGMRNDILVSVNLIIN